MPPATDRAGVAGSGGWFQYRCRGYAAGLVGQIADDIVNIDRAMRWGFAWKQGPFQLLDVLGPGRVIARLEAEGAACPKMLAVLKEAGAASFYRGDGADYLGLDGAYHPVPW